MDHALTLTQENGVIVIIKKSRKCSKDRKLQMSSRKEGLHGQESGIDSQNRPLGRPRLQWKDCVKVDVGSIKPEIPWKIAAKDRDGWREIRLEVWSQ